MNAKRLYDSTAASYDGRQDTIRRRYMRSRERALIKRFACGLTLDVGCGTEPRGIGADFSLPMLREAERKGFTNLVQARAEALPFKSGSIDTVLCLYTVLNICDHEKAAGEMRRVLKPGGKAIVSVTSAWDQSRASLLERIMRDGASHNMKMRIEKVRFRFFCFGRADFLRLFCGFRLVHFSGLYSLARPWWGWRRDFSLPEKAKLRIAFALENLVPAKAARMYFAVFEKSVLKKIPDDYSIMRLLLGLKAEKSFSYDANYFNKVQGFLYKILRSSPYAELHDKKGSKFFCFSSVIRIHNSGGTLLN